MRKYTCYDLPGHENEPITKTESDWFFYYLLEIDKAEYKNFIEWLSDMIKSGLLIKVEEEKE